MQEEIKTYQLTQKEYKIIPLIYEGMTRQAIAENLNVNIRTLDSRIYKILKIVGVKNRVQLISLMARNLVAFDVIETRTSRPKKKLG
jgi:DNA-binding CsgD family transcriptional regulator